MSQNQTAVAPQELVDGNDQDLQSLANNLKQVGDRFDAGLPSMTAEEKRQSVLKDFRLTLQLKIDDTASGPAEAPIPPLFLMENGDHLSNRYLAPLVKGYRDYGYTVTVHGSRWDRMYSKEVEAFPYLRISWKAE